MVIFDPRKSDQDAAFDYQLARLTALVGDMEAIRSGKRAERLAGEEPPTLDRWVMSQRPAICLTGLSTGHPMLAGEARPIGTSDLCLLSDDQAWARTLSRWYRLGRPARNLAHDS